MTITALAIGIISIYFLLFFIVGTLTKNNSIVDMGWGLGFVVTILLSSYIYPPAFTGQYIIIALISIWGLRLTYHLVKRNWGKAEDFRYANWRKEWGVWVIPRAFVQVYLLQGVMMMAIIYPHVWSLEIREAKSSFFYLIGLGVWLIGFFFESVGDHQLKVFKSDKQNKGKLIKSGLWKYTRHPNYFGEATMWWGLYIITLDFLPFNIGLLSPILITYLLRFVSGVPMLEKKYEGREDFQLYKSATNAFIPWFPRR